ncbi:MAG: arylsulfatase A-like enzyme [Bacteroidia bacterium]|jgi:arylsulfatase A-like enzyme
MTNHPNSCAFLGGFALLATSVLGMSCGPSEEPEGDASVRPRNVVLIVVDTLRADRLGCYDYDRDTSPNIDGMAAVGTNFRVNHSQGCWTVPSMISMMSGLYVAAVETALPPYQPTLAETVSQAGYATVAITGNRVLGNDRGFERGFDKFTSRARRAKVHGKAFEIWYANNYLKSAKQDKGFFAWVHLADPHFPYAPAEEHDVFSGQPDSRKSLVKTWESSMEAMAEVYDASLAQPIQESIQLMVEDSNNYDGEVLAADEAIGDLFTFLKQQGVYDETLFIFASDHGEVLYEYPAFSRLLDHRVEKFEAPGLPDYMAVGHRGWMYEEILHTPLIMSGPGIEPGVNYDQQTSNLDIYPTILHALDIAPPMELHGQSLWQDPDQGERSIYSFGADSAAVVEDDGTKLIEYTPRLFRTVEHPQYTHVLSDIGSTVEPEVDVTAQRPADIERMATKIKEWRETYKREVIDQTSPAAAAILAKLGYTED